MWISPGPSTSSASAASTSIAVRAPVPMSVALIETANVPSAPAVADAVAGEAYPGYTDDATPDPISQRPCCRAAGRGSRSDQPNSSAPRRRQPTRSLLLKAIPSSGSTLGSLRIRSSKGRSRPRQPIRPSPIPARTCRGIRRALAARTGSARPVPGPGAGYDGCPPRTSLVAVTTCSTNSTAGEVCTTASWSIDRRPAVHVRAQPEPVEWSASGNQQGNRCRLVKTTRTGRPSSRAAMAARMTLGPREAPWSRTHRRRAH